MNPSAEYDFERFLDDRYGLKLALAFGHTDDHDRIVARIKDLDWQDVRYRYDDSYAFQTTDRDTPGAWTIDLSETVAYELRTRGLPVPPLAEIPWAIETRPFPVAPTRECPVCESLSVVTAAGCERVYARAGWTDRMRVLIDESSPATHLCENRDCGTFFEHEGDMTAYLTTSEAAELTSRPQAEDEDFLEVAFGV